MRVGYFGGTFDPPHCAHLRFATLAADRFQLDAVYVAPTGLQPLKKTPPEAGFEDRLAMVKLLCGGDDRLQASDVDAPHADGTPNYTVDALTALRQQHGADLFVLVGADSFQTVRHWREPDRLLNLAEWIVMSRPESSLEDLSSIMPLESERSRVHVLNDMNDSMSSSDLRNRLRAGVSCGAAIPPAVMLYISRMHLYHAAPRNRSGS